MNDWYRKKTYRRNKLATVKIVMQGLLYMQFLQLCRLLRIIYVK